MRKPLLLLSLIISITGLSQKRSYISFSGGLSLPTGSFARSESQYYGDAPGFAENGVAAELAYVFRSNKSDFGFTAAIKWRGNPYDTSKFLPKYDPFLPSRYQIQWDKQPVWWKLTALMAGGHFSKNITQNFLVNARVIAGVALAVDPAIDWVGKIENSPTSSAIYKANKSTSTCFTSAVGGGFEFAVSKRISILTNAEYWYAMAKLHEVDTYYRVIGPGFTNESLTNVHYTTSMNVVTVNFGVAVGL